MWVQLSKYILIACINCIVFWNIFYWAVYFWNGINWIDFKNWMENLRMHWSPFSTTIKFGNSGEGHLLVEPLRNLTKKVANHCTRFTETWLWLFSSPSFLKDATFHRYHYHFFSVVDLECLWGLHALVSFSFPLLWNVPPSLSFSELPVSTCIFTNCGLLLTTTCKSNSD